MSAPFWLYYALAALLFGTVFCQTDDGEPGTFTIPVTKIKELVPELENEWKVWCSATYDTCTETGRDYLTTGHDVLTQQSSSTKDVMVLIEKCYVFCMKQVSKCSRRL